MLKPIQFDFFQIAVSIEKFVKFVVTFLFHTINIDWIKLDIGRCAGWLRTRLELSSNIMLLLFTKFSKCNKNNNDTHSFSRFNNSLILSIWIINANHRIGCLRFPCCRSTDNWGDTSDRSAYISLRTCAKDCTPLVSCKTWPSSAKHETCHWSWILQEKKNHIIPSLPSRVVSLKLLWRFFQCLERQIARF